MTVEIPKRKRVKRNIVIPDSIVDPAERVRFRKREYGKIWEMEHPDKMREKARKELERYHSKAALTRSRINARRKIVIPDSVTEPADRMRFYKNEFAKRWNAEHPDRIKTNKRKSYLKYRDKNIKYSIEYIKSNPSKRLRYKENSREASKAYAKKIRAKYPERYLSYRNKRRALQLGATVGDAKQIVEFIYNVKASKDTCCRYCGVGLFGKIIHIDHMVPLSRGGVHSVENMCASCQPCNNQKHAKTPEEFAEYLKMKTTYHAGGQ